jgi:hypothetical protein
MTNEQTIPNGPGAAAVLAAGIGCFFLGVFTLLGDKLSALKPHFTFYKPTGPLSGVTTLAIVLWLLSWLLFGAMWKNKTVALSRVVGFAFVLLAASLLLTFPPVIDLF